MMLVPCVNCKQPFYASCHDSSCIGAKCYVCEYEGRVKMLQCSVCTLYKTEDEYYPAKRSKTGFESKCKGCKKEAHQLYYQSTKTRRLAVSKAYKERLRLEVLTHYGNGIPHCKCCGEKELRFLCVHHIEGEGNQHRKSINRLSTTSFYIWIKQNNYPNMLEVLCHNCNMSIGFYGSCPHQEIENGILQQSI